MSEMIGRYALEASLTTRNSGYSRWGFGWKDEERFFIKEFLSPVYPEENNAGLSDAQIARKRDFCRKYELKAKRLYQHVDQVSEGILIRIAEFFRWNGRYYISMPAVESEKWEILKKPETVPWEDRLRICLTLAHSIGRLHRSRIVYADLKPDNLMLMKVSDQHYGVKVTDFDSCFFFDDIPEDPEDLAGDLVYLAPESFRFMNEENANIGPPIDVFALGILFHEILTGELPEWDRERYQYPFEAVLNDAVPVLRPELPEPLQKLIGQMLRKDLMERIPLGVAEEALKAILRGREPVFAERTYGSAHEEVLFTDPDESVSEESEAEVPHIEENAGETAAAEEEKSGGPFHTESPRMPAYRKEYRMSLTEPDEGEPKPKIRSSFRK